MALDLNIQHVLGDVARTNLFEVDLLLMGDDFKFRCTAASLPVAKISELKIPYQNREIKFAGDRTFDDWKISVYNDADQVARRRFIEWQKLVQNLGTNITGALPAEYKAIAQVRQFDRAGNITAEYTLQGLWPKTIDEIALAWGTDTTTTEFGVELSVDWFEPTR